MKFLADMGISPRTVNWLKAMGYDAVHLVDEGLERLPDDEILVRASCRRANFVNSRFGFWLLISSK
ncbi:hypothetical protein NIES4071_30440 [Calothrix sp. NIES-4071]|nr:hypothetical protein NIES4071_30440 [Calothrix sp. NIES-4071]BAZ57364.1 hypothetical protein NIES4105_30380 [Calothrix sp. NIES-4105]